ncbi:MAG: uroporphyrinogen-III C-methyltransferase [Woeseiaceae bacterium]
MSEEPKTEETEIETEIVAETVEQTAAETPAAPKARRSATVIALFALLLAVVAVLASGYVAYNDWSDAASANDGDSAIADLQRRLRDANAAQSELQGALEQLGSRDSDIEAAVGRVESSVDDKIRLVESMPSRMSTLEASIASLQGLSAGARNTLLLAEAEYYMQIANAQLQLAANPELATLALTMADDRIVQIADPALTEVRRALADELAALSTMDKPDIEGVTLTLASLSHVVASLPLAQVSESVREQPAVDPEAGRLSRAWSSVKGVFSGMVTVSKMDEAERPLLAPDDVYFLRTNLSLQLQAARLALLRGEKSVFEQSLDDADSWIGEYFDVNSAQVASARETIAEIRNGMFAIAPPDISQSLRLLRQYQTLAESSE